MSAPVALGLTVMRVGLGITMMMHGYPKVMGGSETWGMLGGAMTAIGISFAPVVWGAAAAFTELIGGALLALGLLTRPAAALLAFTMFVAAMMHFGNGDGFKGASHAIEVGIVMIGLLIIGGGRWSIDQAIAKS